MKPNTLLNRAIIITLSLAGLTLSFLYGKGSIVDQMKEKNEKSLKQITGNGDSGDQTEKSNKQGSDQQEIDSDDKDKQVSGAEQQTPQNKSQANHCVTREEKELFDLINQYRKMKKLPAVPFSLSLSIVARTHTSDLNKNRPDKGKCNMHSWSSKGEWSSCCYTPDHKEAQCMWDKPKELSDYQGYGYEIACGSSGYNLTPSGALKCWQGSPPHNAVMISSGVWSSHPWNAMGVGLYNGYAVVWFGEEKDPVGEPQVCQ